MRRLKVLLTVERTHRGEKTMLDLIFKHLFSVFGKCDLVPRALCLFSPAGPRRKENAALQTRDSIG